MEKAYIQIYTGNGKGKTTASLGLCLRAIANGMKVFYGQFLKSGESSEFSILRSFDNFEYHSFGPVRFICGRNPSEEELKAAEKSVEDVIKRLKSGDYDVMVLDEIFPALNAGLIPETAIENIIKARSEKTELILTGRGAPENIIAIADLVTEMREVKHYWTKGVSARKGIEK